MKIGSLLAKVFLLTSALGFWTLTDSLAQQVADDKANPSPQQESQAVEQKEKRKSLLQRVIKSVTTMGNSEEEEIVRKKLAAEAKQRAAQDKKAAAAAKREAKEEAAAAAKAGKNAKSKNTESTEQPKESAPQKKSKSDSPTNPKPKPTPELTTKDAPNKTKPLAPKIHPSPASPDKPSASPEESSTTNIESLSAPENASVLDKAPDEIGQAADAQQEPESEPKQEAQQLSPEEIRKRYSEARETAMSDETIAQARQEMFDAETENAHHKAGKKFYGLLFDAIRKEAPEISSYIDVMEKAASRKLDAERSKMKEVFESRKKLIDEALSASGKDATQ